MWYHRVDGCLWVLYVLRLTLERTLSEWIVIMCSKDLVFTSLNKKTIT